MFAILTLFHRLGVSFVFYFSFYSFNLTIRFGEYFYFPFYIFHIYSYDFIRICVYFYFSFYSDLREAKREESRG